MSEFRPPNNATVWVCITCRSAADPADAPRAGIALATATALAAANVTDVSVRQVRCLGNCNRGLSAAIRCENTWTYVFGGLNASHDGQALIEGARLLAQASDGIMPWRERPDCLKKGLISRIPPPDFVEQPP